MNLWGSLWASARRNPEKTALVSGSRRISYRELVWAVEDLASRLEAMGLTKGDRIGLLMKNGPEFVATFYAAMKLGLIAVGLNVMFRRSELEYILEDCGARVVVAEQALSDVLRGTVPVARGDIAVLPAEEVLREGDFHARMAASGPAGREDGCVEPWAARPEDDAVIAYTSGTTGFPKGAVHTHENILAHLEGVRRHLGFKETDVFLASLPFFQLVAFLIHPVMAIHVGGTVVIQQKFEPEGFLRAARAEGVTFFAAVPTIYQMLDAASAEAGRALRSVRMGICAGSPLSAELRESFERRHSFRIVHCYGMTETALIVACEDPGVPPRGVSVGQVLPHVRVRIAREDGTPARPTEQGEIHVGAERALRAYWGKPAETAEALRGGWFATGDVGRFDELEHLHIVDRKKDMIIRGGFNVYPAELERVLLSDPRVAEAAVIGIPHERLGEIPKAFVALRHPGTATSEDILDFCREHLASFKVPGEVEIVEPDFFPRNALGKIVKPELRSRLLSDRADRSKNGSLDTGGGGLGAFSTRDRK